MIYSIYILLLLILVLIILVFSIDFDYKMKLKKYTSKWELVIKDIVQEMLNTMSLDIKATDKIENLNKVFIDKLDIKYSTICLYDGYNYEVKASNVEKEYATAIADIVNDKSFKSNISKKNAKYIEAEKGKTLLYKSAMERKIKNALLIPICFEENYLGFVLFEDVHENNLGDISDTILIDLKNNIANFIENVEFQNTLETANIIDSQTNFYNTVYLYSNARKFLATYNNSAMVTIKFTNLPDINDNYGRNIGNLLLVKFANATKEVLGNDNIYVRYSGLRFIIFIKNKTAESVQAQIEVLLSKYKDIYEYVNDYKVNIETQLLIHTLKKQNNLEKEIQKTMSYIDGMENVNTIKII